MLAAAVGFFVFRENLHVVVPGVVLRSAQPTPKMLERLKSRHDLRSVINLRGVWQGEAWFDNEAAAARELGLEFRSIDMATHRLPPPEELRKLIRAFDESPRPLLIHCRHGADRTALAVAIYLVLHENASLGEARGAYRLWYGHTGLAFGRHLPHLFDEYERWLATAGLAHSPAHFRHWALHLEFLGQYGARLVSAELPTTGTAGRFQLTNASREPWTMWHGQQSGVYLVARVMDAENRALETRALASTAPRVEAGGLAEFVSDTSFARLGDGCRVELELMDDQGFRFSRLGCGPWHVPARGAVSNENRLTSTSPLAR